MDFAIKQSKKTKMVLGIDRIFSRQNYAMSSSSMFHFKKAEMQNFKNANEAAEISFTIALYEEHEGAICAICMIV